MYACNGILFNHESPRRGIEFVTRKITRRRRAAIKLGLADGAAHGQPRREARLGLSRATTCEAMWLMLQQDEPDDFVVATGETQTVRELCRVAFAARRAGLRALRRRSIPSSTARPRSTCCSATASKARDVLGWEPKVSFEEMVEMMVDADLERLSKEA